MALIQCPECNKEISDKVKACPHCGYPFETNTGEQNAVQQVEISSVNITPKDPAKTKKNLIIALSSFAVLVLAILVFSIVKNISDRNKFNSYIDNLVTAQTAMLGGGSEAESLLKLTAKVWYNSIFEERDSETDKYTMSGGSGFNNDFNTSLLALFRDSSTIATVTRIEDNQNTVENLMKELQNPPAGLESSYDTALELYSVYKSLTDLAINPSGSLETFTQNKSQKIDKFLELFGKLETQIPEKK